MLKSFYSLVLVLAAAQISAAPNPVQSQKIQPDMLPDRTLECTLSRALNLDPTRNQSRDEIQYEGSYPFSLRLPAIPKRQTPPPDPTLPPEPVHPATGIVSDPLGLATDTAKAFDRVIDMWPFRVEMARAIDPTLSRIIIVSDIDPENGTANLFMARAADAASMDMNNIFIGGCMVKIRNPSELM